MTVPAEIVRKLATFQGLTQEEEDRWGDEIDYKRVHDTTGVIVGNARYYATWKDGGYGGPGEYRGGEPKPWKHHDAVMWLWNQFGLPQPQKLKDDPGFLRTDYLRALEKAGGDTKEAIRTCMDEYRVLTFDAMVKRLQRAGIKNLPWSEH